MNQLQKTKVVHIRKKMSKKCIWGNFLDYVETYKDKGNFGRKK